MFNVVKRQGSFALVQSEQGFAWTMPGPDGGTWYWHADEERWTANDWASPSAEQASRGLDPNAVQAVSEFHHHQTPGLPNPEAGALRPPAGTKPA